MSRKVLNIRMTILAGILLVTTLMMTAPSLYAATQDFKIETFGIVDGNPSMTVKGTAGGTTPPDGEIFAYVFFTNKGIFAVTSHPGIEDSDEVDNDEEWHAHKVKLNEQNCVTDLTEQGKAVLDGNTVSVDNTPATEVTQVLTAHLLVENGEVCVDEVFDSQEEP